MDFCPIKQRLHTNQLIGRYFLSQNDLERILSFRATPKIGKIRIGNRKYQRN
jgi:hypothetical protein